MTATKKGKRRPALANTLVPSWAKPVADKTAQALTEDVALVYAAAVIAFSQLSTETQFDFMNRVKLTHAEKVKAVQAAETDAS